MAIRPTPRRLLLASLLTVWPALAWAQAQPALLPAVGAEVPISLVDGVRQALDRARIVLVAREDLNAQLAAVRQARGTFDAVLQVGPLFEHREDAIENTAFFNPERVKRAFAKGLHEGFGTLATALGDHIRLGRGDLPLCPPDGSYSSYVVTLPGSVFPVPLCRPASQSLGNPSVDPLTTGSLDNSFLYRQALPFNPMSSFDLQLLLASAFRANIATISLEARERSFELLQTLQAAARIVEVKAGLISDRLAELPEYVFADSASVFALYTKPLRSGATFQFRATFDGRGTMFRDKPIDPAFGGTDNPNAFGNRLEWSWIQPFLRGRGGVSVRAAERAAARNVEASRFGYQQTAADQALATADAYFALIAAQESVTLIRESLATQLDLLNTQVRLAAAGTVAAVEVTRARARTAQVEASLESARLDVLSAQAGLADAMGLPPERLMTLVASDAFLIAPTTVDVAALSREAVTRRADVKAIAAFRDTSQILLDASRADARSRFDLKLTGGVAQAYYGPTFHSLGDENGVSLNNDLYLRYYQPAGFSRAFREKWQPVAAVTGTLDLSFGNNQRLGRLAQSMASVRQSEIRVADLSRTIQHNVPKIAEALSRLRLEWEQRQEAVVQHGQSWTTTQQLRAAGGMTLIDTLLTEQQLTDARLQLVEAKRAYASTLARFLRETGTLVDFVDSRAQLNLAGLVSAR